jgi:hypothetical protein
MAAPLELLGAPRYIAASLFNASFELDNSTEFGYLIEACTVQTCREELAALLDGKWRWDGLCISSV